MTAPRSASQRLPVAFVVIAAAITAVSIVLIWATAALPPICPAVYPALPSCAADARTAPATWGTVMVATLFVATVVAGLAVPAARKETVLRVARAVLAIAGVGAITMTLFASGFAIGF